MIRTQIMLQEEQYQFLKEQANRTGASLSALIREAVEVYRADRSPQKDRAARLLGAFQADRNDVSLMHDDYLPFGDK